MLKTLSNGLLILDCFNQKKSWTINELSEEVNINKTTVYKSLKTFESFNLIIKNENTNKYELGYKFLEYYSTLKGNSVFSDKITDIMNNISEKTEQTVFFSFLQNEEAVCLKISEYYNNYLRFSIKVGSSSPVHIGSRGKVMLAYLPVEKRNQIIKQNSIANETLLKELREIKKQCWYITKRERFKNVIGVNVTIFYNNKIITTITIATAEDVSDKNIKEWVRILKDKQEELENIIKIQEKDIWSI